MGLNYLPLAQAKNGDKQFHAFNEKAQHECMRGQDFFLFGGGGGDNELFFFPCSHHVSNGSQVVPQDDPNRTSDLFIPYGFVQISTLKYIN